MRSSSHLAIPDLRSPSCGLLVRKRISLERAITLSILLIGFLSGTVGLAYAYWHAKESLHTTIGLNFRELARQSADKVGVVLAREIEWVERLGELLEVREAVKEHTRLAFNQPRLQQWWDEQRQYFRSFAIVDREGGLVGASTSEATRSHYKQQPWWIAAMRLRQPWGGDLHVDNAGRGYWEVATPVMDHDGDVLGVLKVVIGVNELFAPALRTRIGRTGHLMLVNDAGRVLICPIIPPGLHMSVTALTRTGAPDRPTPMEAYWTEVRDDSHGWHGGIVGIAPIRLPSTMTQERVWHILVRQDSTETYAPAVSLMWKLGIFWVGAVGLVAWVGSRLAHRIARPLEGLVNRIHSFGEGQPIVQREVAKTPGIIEIDSLEASFNALTDRLQKAAEETQRNLDELARTNLELAKSEEHYRTLWNHAMDVKVIVDARGTIQDVNRRLELKLERRGEELVGTGAIELFQNKDRDRFAELLRQVLEKGKEASATDMHVSTAGNATLTMDLDIVPVEHADRVTRVLLQLSDMTEKRQLEQQLIRSERLASLSQFASMFAHDIRNPLAGIKKTLELLAQRPELQSGPMERWFGDLQLTTDLLLGMINDMLDVYQESYSGLPLVPSRFSARTLVQDWVHLFRLEAEARHVDIQVVRPEEDIMLTGDRRRLQRVGINLVHNALKYSPSGGIVTVTVRLAGESTLPAGMDVSDRCVLLTVEDEGPGIDPQEHPHIFELFFRKKDGRDLRIGRGLGLHFCRLVVEAHRGRIWAVNRPAGGARFSVALPSEEEICRSGW